ncbi:cyclodeaminase [Halobacillus andaensis]|uniref:Cyclodeaminase n=1 Tax=Halobacillus andaensis TaxID=1176239 RepID=A0A917B3V6_HALAA|nr:cyclodeaminase [Halobacillus andaensis]MBP2004662.1 ornithine cyclodeaminase [Halobacillus andaensis]GGF19903.1 cyclodeaminase [Halobacillus andaensis]
MGTIRLYKRDRIDRVIRLDTNLINEVEGAFTDLTTKQVMMPPIMRIDVPQNNGEVDIKSAYIEGLDSFAVKLSSGFFDNPKRGLPSANGMMILLSAVTGEPLAIFADNGLLTDLRTAAAGAVAARSLSREDSRVAGVIGTGSQARYQIEALMNVRDIQKVYVYGRSIEKADQYKRDIESRFTIPVEVKQTAKEVVQGSDLVITTTPATDPVIHQDWIHPGLHITAMGSDAEHKQELDAKVLEAADLFVCDVVEQSLRLGELRSCANDQVRSSAIELGEITSERKNGRSDPNQITICDLTGTGAQDTAIARYVYQLLDTKEDEGHERS